MGKSAFLKVEQLAHSIPTKQETLCYGVFRFTVALTFEGNPKWIIGRRPDLTLYPNHENIYCIYLPSQFLTRTLAVIHTTKSVYESKHIIQGINARQPLIESVGNAQFVQKPLRNNDRFHVSGFSFLRFKYLVLEDKDVSGDLAITNDTYY